MPYSGTTQGNIIIIIIYVSRNLRDLELVRGLSLVAKTTEVGEERRKLVPCGILQAGIITIIYVSRNVRDL